MADRAQKIEKHEHLFGANGLCACGSLRVPSNEIYRRIEEWDRIYELSKDSESAQTYSLCLQAWKSGDFGAVKHFASLAKERLAENNYIPKPSYPDPRVQKYEILLQNGEPTGYVALRKYGN